MTSFCILGKFLFLLFLAPSQGSDPCVNNIEIDNPFRSTSYVIKPGDRAICDNDIKLQWYRFVNKVGGTMPESKVDVNHCGTIAPIWMRGQHPSIAEGVVDRVACVNYRGMSNGCFITIQIKVKNCSDGFYVYYLRPTHGCSMAYCAGMLLNFFFQYQLQQNRFLLIVFFFVNSTTGLEKRRARKAGHARKKKTLPFSQKERFSSRSQNICR